MEWKGGRGDDGMSVDDVTTEDDDDDDDYDRKLINFCLHSSIFPYTNVIIYKL